MPSQDFTIATRFKYDEKLMDYLNKYVTEYNEVYREMWYIMTSSNYSIKYPKDSTFVSEMCSKHTMLKRTINSIRFDIKGRIRALKALKKTELKQINSKIKQQEIKVKNTEDYINKNKLKAQDNTLSENQLKNYKANKQRLYYQKNKLNKLKQRYNNLKYEIDNNIFKIGFGGKKTFIKQYNLKENGYKTKTKWKNDYIKSRDKNIFYLGSSDETCGNQLCQLSYNTSSKDFTMKLRKEYKYCKAQDNKDCNFKDSKNLKSQEDNYIIVEHIKFKHLCAELINALNHSKPISFRMHRVNNKWYLQCIFNISFYDSEYTTFSQDGVLGLDYNNGFIEMCETNYVGSLINQFHYDLKFHGTGTKAENEIRQTVSKIVKLAEEKHKDIVIEDLDFKDLKAKTSKGKTKRGKNYNRMIHLFDYSRYKESFANSCHRHRVTLRLVNPKNTSKIGKQKYCFSKKLNVHQAASFVIARRGQGFNDKLSV